MSSMDWRETRLKIEEIMRLCESYDERFSGLMKSLRGGNDAGSRSARENLGKISKRIDEHIEFIVRERLT